MNRGQFTETMYKIEDTIRGDYGAKILVETTKGSFCIAMNTYVGLKVPVYLTIDDKSRKEIVKANKLVKEICVRFGKPGEIADMSQIAECAKYLYIMQKENVIHRAERVAGQSLDIKSINMIIANKCTSKEVFFKKIVRKIAAIYGVLYNSSPFEICSTDYEAGTSVLFKNIYDKNTNEKIVDKYKVKYEDILSIELYDDETIECQSDRVSDIMDQIRDVRIANPEKIFAKYI